MNLKKAKAQGFIARHVLLHMLKLLVARPIPGLRRFFERYRADRIFAVSPRIRSLMPDFSSCHSCRLCDAACPQTLSSTEFVAPSYVISSFSRSLTDHGLFAATAFDCADCRACENACPQHVPIPELIAFMRENAVNGDQA